MFGMHFIGGGEKGVAGEGEGGWGKWRKIDRDNLIIIYLMKLTTKLPLNEWLDFVLNLASELSH